jgi:hypothetical protein
MLKSLLITHPRTLADDTEQARLQKLQDAAGQL